MNILNAITATPTTQADLRKLAKMELWAYLVTEVAPIMLRDREECMADPDWNGQQYWLCPAGIGEGMIGDPAATDAVFDAWEALTAAEERGMLADAFDCYLDGLADNYQFARGL